jgi:hypothetical protein
MPATHWVIGIALSGSLLCAASHAATTEEDFQLRTTSDLVDLCSTPPTDVMGTAALNFCHGFALGVYRVLEQEQAASARSRLFCVQGPTPSRNQAIADFVQWARATPTVMSQPPADGIAAYLVHRFPCARGK